jgi:hypothetical protein
MRINSTPTKIGRSRVEVKSLETSPLSSQAEDERTIKFMTPRKTRAYDKLSSEDIDS